MHIIVPICKIKILEKYNIINLEKPLIRFIPTYLKFFWEFGGAFPCNRACPGLITTSTTI